MTADRRSGDHAAFRLLAAAAVDGWIDPFDAVDLEAHLATCPACRADQRAMLADRAWLANPARPTAPDPHVRAAILQAARTARVPRTSRADRQWSALAAAALVVAVTAGGLILSAHSFPPAGSVPSGSTPVTTTLESERAATLDPNAVPTDGIPFVRFTGQAKGRAETIGGLDLVVSVQGLGNDAQGTVEISRNGEEPWAGTILSANYWHGAYGPEPHWVAQIEGCIVGVNPCQQYALQLFDGGDSIAHPDDVRFWMPASGATEPPDATRVYQVVTGDLVVGGSMPRG